MGTLYSNATLCGRLLSLLLLRPLLRALLGYFLPLSLSSFVSSPAPMFFIRGLRATFICAHFVLVVF